MKKSLYSFAAALLLAGCASSPFVTNVAPGTPREQVLAQLGPPTRIVLLPGGGQRLQYSQQPAGQFAWMVDVDASGRVVSSRQVLDEQDFHRIAVDQWTGADVEREFGPPARVDHVASWNGPILTYRWRDVQGADMFYFVYLDPHGIVRRAHPAMEVHDRMFRPF